MIYDNFLRLKNKEIFKKRVAVYCNHTSFDFNSGRYFLNILEKECNLKKVFVPEHGFFAEWQDQDPVKKTTVYNVLSKNTRFISLYGSNRSKIYSLIKKELSETEILIIDIQDIGSRYFTYISLIKNIFEVIHAETPGLKVIVIDRPNPAGRQVEGTLMNGGYSSFVGMEGLIHRHGLTLGEMCLYLRDLINASFQLEVIRYSNGDWYNPVDISPSPNMPSINAVRLYTGLCLLEGTNISEGRGTTRPFEIFGAPYMKFLFPEDFGRFKLRHPAMTLRPLLFRPVYHKYAEKLCYGCQVHITGKKFHSLYFGLSLIRYVRQHAGTQFKFLKGPYESGSSKPAIEVLAGDKILLDYMKGTAGVDKLKNRLVQEQAKWINNVSDFLLYKQPLISAIPE